MSCHGSRETAIFTFKVEHEIAWSDDTGDHFTPYTTLEIRVWKWELTVKFDRIYYHRSQWRHSYHKHRNGHYLHLQVPRIGGFEIEANTYPAHRFQNDYTEHTEARRKGKT